MKIVIYANINAGRWIRKVGKYLYDRIDGAYKLEFHPNDCDIRMRMYYQVPNDPETFNEMKFIINVTSYQNKLRVNLTEDTEYENTIGQLILQPEEVLELSEVKSRVIRMIRKAITKEYAEFDFIY